MKFRSIDVAAALAVSLAACSQDAGTKETFGTLGGAAIFVLRARRPELPRPYRALGYPVVPALYVLGSFALVWNTLMERPTESIAGLGLVAMGLPFYLYWSRSAR